jgi:RNA polymerase sigma factor (sigma-70 family)
MPPPTAEPFASRVLLGPALRTQSDRRLVRLVRQGYETAFEEIVRRYRRPLVRFAAGIVGGRSEDVTQDALSKALLALRGSENEIELRPWLYRIVRNTALNDVRDSPPSAEELGETIPGGLSAAAEAERREEMADLVERLQALPEPQRAAIVMRELEGLSHEEIAAALGVSGGAARQTIHRARTALRDGFGMLIPLPLLRVLADHGAEAAGGAAVAGAGAASGGGIALGGLGAGGAVKVGVATALIAGTVGAGVAIDHNRGGNDGASPAAAAEAAGGRAAPSEGSSGSGTYGDNPVADDHGEQGESHRGHKSGDNRSGRGHGSDGGSGPGRNGGGKDRDRSGSGHGGLEEEGQSGSSHGGPDPSDTSGGGSGSGSSGSGSGSSGGSGSGGG